MENNFRNNYLNNYKNNKMYNQKENIKFLKNKKDCCMQSLKDVNCFLYSFSTLKKAINIFKWFN